MDVGIRSEKSFIHLISRGSEIMKVYRFFIFSLLSLISIINHAQFKSGSIKHYGTEEGLPSNLIYYIEQDKLGYIWLGTDAGLVRFDGSNFKVFTTEQGLPSNDVISLFCDSKNRLWISGFGKEICYLKDGNITSKFNDSSFNKFIVNNNYVNPVEDKKKDILIVSSYNKLLLYNGCDFLNISNSDYNLILKLLPHKEKIYLLSDRGLLNLYGKGQNLNSKKNKVILDIIFPSPELILSITSDNIVDVDTFIDNQLPYNYVCHGSNRFIYADTDSSAWINSPSGYKLINLKDKNLRVLDEFKSLNVTCIFRDRDNNTWVSTLDKGLYKIYAKGVRTIGEPNLNTNNTYYSLQVQNGIVYSGNMVGEIWKFKPLSKPELLMKLKGLANKNRVLQLGCLNKNKLVIAADYKSLVYDLGKHKILKKILGYGNFKNLYIGSDSIIFLSGVGLIYSSTKNYGKSFLPLTKSTYSACLYNEKLVFGTIDGLYILENRKYVPFLMGENLGSRVSDLQTDGQYLYASTVEKGVFKIKGNKCVEHFSTENGLPSNSCNKLLLKNDELYIATKKGIAIFEQKKSRVKYLFERDGLISDNVNNIAIYNDSLITATDRGISIFRISQLLNPLKPLFFLTTSDYQKDSIHHSLTIKSRSNKDLTIFFNSISFENSGKMKYFYKIFEKDTSWSYTIDQSKQLNGLSPGFYHFQAFAQTSYGIKSNTINLTIEIVPYFYQTAYFKIATAFALWGLLYLFYRHRIGIIKTRERHQKELDHRITTLELSAWRSKMNPHFIFNSLNAMQSLFEDKDFLTGNKYIVNFSKILRKTIESSSNLFNTVIEEIDYQTNYLELDKLKKDGHLSYSINAPEDLHLYYIPSMVLQPIIENSIKHGIKNSQDGKIIIDFRKVDNTISCSISDNGGGIEIGNKDSSQGISLVREKLALVKKLIDYEVAFKYENIKNGDGKTIGLKTLFIFPLLSAANIKTMNLK